MSVQGAEDISAGPVWCYPRDQSQLLDIGHRRESPSVTTTLFTLYLRILLYNKFDVAKPSDHITTIKLIPPSYSGGPRSGPAKSVSRITNNKLSLNSGRNFVFWGFFSILLSQPMFLFSSEAIVFVPVLTWSKFAHVYNTRVNGTAQSSTPPSTFEH